MSLSENEGCQFRSLKVAVVFWGSSWWSKKWDLGVAWGTQTSQTNPEWLWLQWVHGMNRHYPLAMNHKSNRERIGKKHSSGWAYVFNSTTYKKTWRNGFPQSRTIRNLFRAASNGRSFCTQKLQHLRLLQGLRRIQGIFWYPRLVKNWPPP